MTLADRIANRQRARENGYRPSKGSRVRLEQATGTVTPHKRDDDSVEVLWDTGARCAVPLEWLTVVRW